MAISTRLRTVYASAPTDTAIIATLDMELPGEHVRLVDDFEDMTLGVNGVPQVFEACGLDIALPTKDNSGNQSLQFALEKFQGTLIFVSHDREFVSGLATRVIEILPSGEIVDYHGPYEEYLAERGIEN